MIKAFKKKKPPAVEWVEVSNETYQLYFNPRKDDIETYELMHFAKGHALYPVGYTFMIWARAKKNRWTQLFKQEEKLGKITFWIEKEYFKELKA